MRELRTVPCRILSVMETGTIIPKGTGKELLLNEEVKMAYLGHKANIKTCQSGRNHEAK
jgi:ABC-type lipopolysaccharide export system ATPase subunit